MALQASSGSSLHWLAGRENLAAVPGALGLAKALADGDELPSHGMGIVDGTRGELLGSQLDGLVLEENIAALAVGLLDLVSVDLVALLPVVGV